MSDFVAGSGIKVLLKNGENMPFEEHYKAIIKEITNMFDEIDNNLAALTARVEALEGKKVVGGMAHISNTQIDVLTRLTALEQQMKALEGKQDTRIDLGEMKVVIDETVPPNSILFKLNGKEVGRIINIGEQAQPSPAVTGEGWRKELPVVWTAFRDDDEWVIDRVRIDCVDINDLWQPYDPAHPEPPEPPKSEVE